MTIRLRTWLFSAVLCGLLAGVAQAQPHRFLEPDDPALRWVARLQARGHLLSLSPSASGITEGALRDALEALDPGVLTPLESRWQRHLLRRFPTRPAEEQTVFGVAAALGSTVSTSRRLDDPFRPLGPDSARATLPLGASAVYPEARLGFSLAYRWLHAEVLAHHSVYLNDTPDGFDVVNRLMTRTAAAYVHASSAPASVVVGRRGRHWAPPERPGLMLNGAAYPMDALEVRLGGSRLHVRSLLAELDSALPDGTLTPYPADASNALIRRYLAAHRLEYRPHPRVAISIQEAILFSGPGVTPSLTFLNPLLPVILESDQVPKNAQNNALVGGSLWLQPGRWTLYGEALIDDFDLLNGQEPAAFALLGTVSRAGRWHDAGVEVRLVAPRTYNAPQPEGDYLYAGRGMGVLHTDHIRAEAWVEAYGLDALRAWSATVRGGVLWQGAGTILSENPQTGSKTLLLDPVTRSLVGGGTLRYEPSPHVWAEAGGFLHAADRPARTRFVGHLAFGVRLDLRYSGRGDL